MSTGRQWFKKSYGKQKWNTNPFLCLVSITAVEGSAGSRSAYLGEAGNEAESPWLCLCIPGREPGHSHRRVKEVTKRSTALGWKDLVLFSRNLACSCYGNRIRRMQKGTLLFFPLCWVTCSAMNSKWDDCFILKWVRCFCSSEWSITKQLVTITAVIPALCTKK